jgi:hypothetical protein
MLLGDRIKEATSALGVKPCTSCEERAAMLNLIGRNRRGFIANAALLLFVGKNALLDAAWQLAGATPPVSVEAARGFVQQFNTTQLVWYFNNQRHASLDEAYQEIIKHKEHFKPGTGAYSWMSRFNPFSKEVLPGWTIDFVQVQAGYPRWLNDKDEVNDGYRLILRGDRHTIITDEDMVVYQAKTPETVPAAASLQNARDFPGAVPFDLFKDDAVSLWNRIERFFTPTTVHAQICECTPTDHCIPCNGCANCLTACCSNVTCSSIKPAHGCVAAIGCSNCKILSTVCNSGTCTDCIMTYGFNFCCQPLKCGIEPIC